MGKVRNANIELLRIFSILMIISHHYYAHTKWTDLTNVNENFLRIIGSGARIAIACFVLITGFYGENIKPGRIAKLVINRWIYSFIITLLLLIIKNIALTKKLFFNTLFPLLSCRHNYITTFCMLYLFIPFLNNFVDSSKMTRRGMKVFIALSAALFSLIPSIVPQFANNTYCYIFWMMYLYIIGRCLKKYEFRLPWRLLLIVFIGINIVCYYVIELHTFYAPYRMINLQYSFTNLVIPVCLLMIFADMDIKNGRVINYLAKSTFAVYIIHDDPYIRKIIWTRIFHNSIFGASRLLPVHWFCTVIGIYAV